MLSLPDDYHAHFGLCGRTEWQEVINRFSDCNLYQTWSFDMVRMDRKNVAHMILRRNTAIVAAALARIRRIPGTRLGMAYIFWGPMWRLAEAPDEVEVFRLAIRAIRNEYSIRRGLVVRLFPIVYKDNDCSLEKILREEGYRLHDEGRTHRTLLIDLAPSLEEIRTSLDQKWRNCLNSAEKRGLELVFGEGEDLLNEVEAMYQKMVTRKRLSDVSDIDHLKLVQRDLPQSMKLKAVVCRVHGEACAGAIFSAHGRTGVYLIGATAEMGMTNKASYLIQWAFVKWLKEHGYARYDLNGINPETNPGSYHFKRGLAGKSGKDVALIGKYQVSDSVLSSLAVTGGERLVSKFKSLKQAGSSFLDQLRLHTQ